MVSFKFLINNAYKEDKKHINFHFHNYYELVYYIKGDGYSESFDADVVKKNDGVILYYYDKKITYEKQVFNFTNMSYVIYPPYTIHNEVHKKYGEVIAIGFELSGQELKIDLKKNIDANYIILPLLQKILQEYQSKQIMYEKLIENLLAEILILVTRESNITAEAQNPMVFVEHYISENFAKDIELDKLASLSGYSKAHFRQLFKNFTGYSPKAYIMQKRYERARELILNTQLSLSNISEMCGFNYYAQFYEFFLKYSGKTPNDLRKQDT